MLLNYTAVFAKNLESKRIEGGLTQRELSEKLGVTPRMYSYYESGKVSVPISFLIAVSVFFNISCNWLIGLNEPITTRGLLTKTSVVEYPAT